MLRRVEVLPPVTKPDATRFHAVATGFSSIGEMLSVKEMESERASVSFISIGHWALGLHKAQRESGLLTHSLGLMHPLASGPYSFSILRPNL